ncbi:uncharacterized protein DSM5745_05161 [Aspergillus mulundensis]|uniref:Uncharacterized protein n=1 Tax=Aspergillus mulundensis TaxID=1810919 RepID=A0A3D8S6G6_9EURO|nr:Uncharacterized protein DSM5745_05161 [Aspergillus mulundensis]RDW81604.1 Uncharacterized protein DSM5745_05161 [Aspergillus mulundensis]
MTLSDPPRAALSTLETRHLELVRNTVLRILSTKQAEDVFAEVADGLPTQETAKYKPHCDEEELDDRTQPSARARDLVRTWRSDFDLGSLELESNVISTYQQTPLQAREFKARLIEITAVVIHTLAALLFSHTNHPPYKKPPPKNKIVMVDGWPQVTDELVPSRVPTYLYHNDYLDDDIYPLGIADIAAYWAETHLFGGVVVFYQGDNETELPTDLLPPSSLPLDDKRFLDVYLHPDCRFKVFRLSDAQIDQFVGFGVHGEPSASSPFPLKPERNTVRLFPAIAMSHYNVYRSKNDRKVREIDIARLNWGGRMEDDPQMMELVEERKKAELKQGNDGI